MKISAKLKNRLFGDSLWELRTLFGLANWGASSVLDQPNETFTRDLEGLNSELTDAPR
jgi:hypothetical protein